MEENVFDLDVGEVIPEQFADLRVSGDLLSAQQILRSFDQPEA